MATDATGLDSSSPLPLDSPQPVLIAREAASLRDVVSWILWAGLADWSIFRTLGMTGPAVFLALAPLVFLLGCRQWAKRKTAMVVALILWAIAARLVWSGGVLLWLVGLLFVAGLALAAAGEFPFVIESVTLAARAWIDGLYRVCLGSPWRTVNLDDARAMRAGNNLTFPIIAAIAFGSLFVFANPDLAQWFGGRLKQWQTWVWKFAGGFSVWELPFCIFALVIGAGLMRPLRPLFMAGPRPVDAMRTMPADTPSPLYEAFRNTLWTLIVLFAAYLCFEFVTLWRRDFPPGFYYAGYAHQGAAWLTVALALATMILSFMFSSAMLSDTRLSRLRSLAWIWSLENFLLAIAVYNRLGIYINYNGMTRMRTIGLFGITVVVIGLVLVLIKIKRERSFWWLVRFQLLALFLTVTAYLLFPVDYVAQRYNAARIRQGRLHPAVMIAVKPIDDEGVFPLLQLIDTEDQKIREGVRAMLAERQLRIERFSRDGDWHWTQFEGAKAMLYPELAKNESKWATYRGDAVARQRAIDRFVAYSMQWY